MATILITTTTKYVRFKVGENPIKRFNKEVEVTVTQDGFTNINVISNLIPLLTFRKDDDISINGDVQDPGMDIEDLCDAIQELFPDPGTGTSSGLTSVATDDTLTGDGTSGNPLGEANPVSPTDITNWNNAASLAATALQSESDPVWESEKSGYYTKTEADAAFLETEADTLETVTTRGSTTDKDIEITDATKGIIMKTGDGTRVRVSVIKDGNGDIRLNPVILIFILCASLLFNSAKAQFQNLIGRDTVNLSYRLDTMSNYLLADNFYGRLTGLVVSYSGSGLTFNVTAGYFRLRDGALRFSPGGSVTLSAADATNPRWDVIGVDTTGAILKKTGSAAASPSIPQVDDPESQLELTSVEILANEVIPSTIVQNIIYDENSGDAFTGTNTGVTVNYNNTLNVQHGSKSADVGSWTNGQTITFTKNTGTLNASDFTVLPFFIKLKSTLANTANVRISFLNGTTVVSNVLTLGATDGFSKNNTNYQNVSVAISRFTFTSTTFNKIKITLAGTGGGFYLDYMQLQSGLSVSSPETDPVANAKTVSMITGYGIIIPQSTTQTLNTNPIFTPSIDTFAMETRVRGLKVADSIGTSGIIDVAQYILSGTYGTDTTAAVNQAGIDASNSSKKTIRFSSAISNYVLKCHYRNGSSSLNRMGFEVPSGVTVIVDKGATVTTDTAWTVSTTNGKIYPLFNSIGRSNITYIINGELAGQKTTYGTYTLNPNTNPNGYDTDSTHRWSNSGIQAKDCDNITIKGDGYIHDFQAMGIQIINTTRADVSKIRSAFNGSSGIRYFVKSTGKVSNVTVDHNTSDNVRFDSCYYHIGIYDSHISWSGYGEVGSSNGFANIYTGGDTKGLDVVNCDLHDAQSYNLDLGNAKYTHVVNPTFSYAGNGAIVTLGYLTVDGGELKNNGKRTDGTSDPASNYNNGGIVMNNAVQVNVTGTTFTDTASGYQDYVATKNWGGGGSAGFTNCNFVNCTIKGAADTAHIWNGNIGHNNLSINKFQDLSGNTIVYGTSGNYLQLQSDGTWKDAAASAGGVTTMSAFTNTSNATGATISGSNLQMTGADTTNAGEVSVSTAGQYFLGPKFFSTGNNGATPGYWTRGLVLINRNTAFTGDGGRTSPQLEFNSTGTHSNGGTTGAVDTAKFQFYVNAPVGFNGLVGHLILKSQLSANAATTEMDLAGGAQGVAFNGTVGAGTTSPGVAAAGTFFGAALTSSSTVTLTTAASQELKYVQGSISRGKFYTDGNYTQLGSVSGSAAYPGTEQDAMFSLYSPANVGTGTTTAGGTTVTALTQAKNYWKIGDVITIGGESKTITAVNSNTQVTISGTFTGANTNQPVTKTAVSVLTAQGNGQVGIGTATPQGALDIVTTLGGVVLPRLTKAQRDAISSPVAGTAVYQTDNTPGLRVYNGTNWMRYTETAD